MPPLAFIPNPAFEEELYHSEELVAWLMPIVEEVAAAARTKAPFAKGGIERGITAEVEMVRGQWVGRVIATDWKSKWHEFGTKQMPAHPFLLPGLIETLPGAKILRGGKAPD